MRQDYAGEKELIIVNDFSGQELYCDAPSVHIMNSKRRFRTIGEKRNTSIALSTGDVIFPWDDDDIHLPNRISHSLASMEGEFYNPRTAWILNNTIKGPVRNALHGIGCFTRDLFDHVGGYPHINSGQDLAIERLFADVKPLPQYQIDAKDIYYLYRWSDTDSWHLSACGVDSVTGKNGADMFAQRTQAKVDAGQLKLGRIELTHFWKMDYPSVIESIRNAAQD